MGILIKQDSRNGLKRETWEFSTHDELNRFYVALSSYQIETRTSRNRKFKTEKCYVSGLLWDSKIPLPGCIKNAALRKAIAQIRVVKWSGMPKRLPAEVDLRD